MKKILITGGLGFIGLNLINYLQKYVDCEITVLDNESKGNRKDLHSSVHFIYGDIKDQKYCHGAILGNDTIIHLAAQTEVPKSVAYPIEDARTNTLGTLNLLELSKVHHVKKFIFASSNAVIGDVQSLPIKETMPTNPISPYGISKLSAENYCRFYNQIYSIPTVVLRFSNIYGKFAKHKSSVIAKFIRKIENDDQIEIYGDGNQTRDFLHVDDLCGAIVACIFHNQDKYQLYNIGSGKPTSINELVEILKRLYYPKELDINYVNERKGDIKNNYSSIVLANAILRWKPKIELEDGLKGIINV